MVGNVGLWRAETFRWRRVTEDLKMGGPCHLKRQQLAKLIKIKVLLHQFPNLIFILHYLCYGYTGSLRGDFHGQITKNYKEKEITIF